MHGRAVPTEDILEVGLAVDPGHPAVDPHGIAGDAEGTQHATQLAGSQRVSALKLLPAAVALLQQAPMQLLNREHRGHVGFLEHRPNVTNELLAVVNALAVGVVGDVDRGLAGAFGPLPAERICDQDQRAPIVEGAVVEADGRGRRRGFNLAAELARQTSELAVRVPACPAPSRQPVYGAGQ